MKYVFNDEEVLITEMARAIVGIAHDDLSTAEKKIFTLLRNAGWLSLNEHSDVCWTETQKTLNEVFEDQLDNSVN